MQNEQAPEIEVPVPIKRRKRRIQQTNGGDIAYVMPEVQHKTDAIVKPQRKIAIFGTTPSRMEGPIGENTGWERWTIGPGGKDTHGWERLFEVHGVWPADFQEYLNSLSNVKPPRQVITIPQFGNAAESWKGAIARWKREHKLADDVITGDWSAIVRYPREHILEKYGRRFWFSSSISWCIALAIEEGASDIGLWGIDLESGEEYISQFIGCAHLLDLARLAGINIHLPAACGLMRDPTPYPDRYETHLALTLEKKVKFIENVLRNMEPEYEGAKAEVHRQEGRLLLMKELSAPIEKIQETERALIAANMRVGQLACNINQLKGELGASQFYRRMYVWGFNEPNSLP